MAAAAAGVLAMSSLLCPAAAAQPYSEDAVKAAYLYRFAGYIDWPGQGSTDTPFIIDVLGAPGIAQELRRLLPSHPIHNRVAQVREITGIRELGGAQIIYVAAGRAQLLRSLRPQASGAMLLVSDEEGGLGAGSVLNFLNLARNVRFEVSLSAAQHWGLKISSELLGVAVRVQGRGGQSFLGCAPRGGSGIDQSPCGPRLAAQRRIAPAHPCTEAE